MLSVKRHWLSFWFLAVILLFVPTFMAAGKRAIPNGGPYNPNDTTVDMFKAIDDGLISVKFIPKNSKQANVLIENKSDKPLNVKLPDAFAGVPVLAQGGLGGFGGGSGRNNRNGGGNQNQSMGGGMGGMGMGGMGMMNIAPEKVGQMEVKTVCLEHGKAEPKPAVPYEIKPIDSFTQKEGVKELCQMIGTGKIDQRSAQAAAWHLSNEMSWQELAAKKIKHANGSTEPYFSVLEIKAAMELAGQAKKLAAETEKKEPAPSSKENYETPTRK